MAEQKDPEEQQLQKKEKKKDDSLALSDSLFSVRINPVSVEVMEWGLMTQAAKFTALLGEETDRFFTDFKMSETERSTISSAVILTSLVEFERMKHKLSYCSGHRTGVRSAVAALPLSWCDSLKDSNYQYNDPSRRGGVALAVEGMLSEHDTINAGLVALFALFDTRVLQLGLGALCGLLVVVVFRFCFMRMKNENLKTF
jgi:hypothetical protein